MTGPLVAIIELTQNCNLACDMCRERSKRVPGWDMEWSLFERIEEEILPHAKIVDLRGWGESTIYPHFDRALDAVIRAGARPRLVTNGQRDLPAAWEAILGAGGTVALSCDASNPELFSKLRGRGSLRRLQTTARSLTRARAKTGADRSSVTMIVTVSGDNLDDLPDLVYMAVDLGVFDLLIAPIGTGLETDVHLRHHLDRIPAVLDEVRQVAATHHAEVRLGSALDPSLAVPKVDTGPCIRPWTFCYVNFRGQVGFCDHLIGDESYAVGDLRDEHFADIWNGAGFGELRKAHADDAIPERFSPCRWCKSQRYVDFEDHVLPEAKRSVVALPHDVVYTQRDPIRYPPLEFRS